MRLRSLAKRLPFLGASDAAEADAFRVFGVQDVYRVTIENQTTRPEKSARAELENQRYPYAIHPVHQTRVLIAE